MCDQKLYYIFFLHKNVKNLYYPEYILTYLSVQVNLKEQGQLIRQDEFLVFFRKKKYYRHIFLFQDLVLFSKTKKTEVGNDIYIYKQSFKVIILYTVHPCDCIKIQKLLLR